MGAQTAPCQPRFLFQQGAGFPFSLVLFLTGVKGCSPASLRGGLVATPGRLAVRLYTPQGAHIVQRCISALLCSCAFHAFLPLSSPAAVPLVHSWGAEGGELSSCRRDEGKKCLVWGAGGNPQYRHGWTAPGSGANHSKQSRPVAATVSFTGCLFRCNGVAPTHLPPAR